jgi:hypothetical protein
LTRSGQVTTSSEMKQVGNGSGFILSALGH